MIVDDDAEEEQEQEEEAEPVKAAESDEEEGGLMAMMKKAKGAKDKVRTPTEKGRSGATAAEQAAARSFDETFSGKR
jgi:hypothetical protein